MIVPTYRYQTTSMTTTYGTNPDSGVLGSQPIRQVSPTVPSPNLQSRCLAKKREMTMLLL